jgi:hypothetical protein
VVSRLVAVGAGADQVRDAAYFAADAAAEELAGKLRLTAKPTVVLCPNRAPNVDGSDFAPEIVGELSNCNVLFEIWGNLQTRDDAGLIACSGTVSYLVVPVREHGGTVAQDGLLRQSYQHDAKGLPALFGDMFTAGRHFEVFAAVALGVHDMTNARFDQAQAALCHAHVELQRSRAAHTWTASSAAADHLLGTIGALVDENRNRARSAGYRGPLTLTAAPGSPPCPDAGASP